MGTEDLSYLPQSKSVTNVMGSGVGRTGRMGPHREVDAHFAIEFEKENGKL